MAGDEKVTRELNVLLADATVFYQKLRHYHWNVSGRHFFELHAKFEDLYGRWATTIDEIAERILTVGGVPLHTLGKILEHASLEEDSTLPSAPEMVDRTRTDLDALHERAGALIGIAEEAGDRGTANLLDDLRDGIEKDLWMLDAWKQQAAGAWS